MGSLTWHRVSRIETVRGEWLRFVRDRGRWGPASDPDRIGLRPGRPHVLVARRSGRIAALLAGSLERRPLVLPLGYLRLQSPALDVLTLPLALTDGSPAAARAVDRRLRRALSDGIADVVEMPELPLDDPLADRLAARAVPRPVVEKRYRLSLAAGPGTGGRGGHARKRAQQHRRLARELGAEPVLECFSRPAEVEPFLAAARPLAARTWQDPIGGGLPPRIDAELHLEASRGRLLAYLLRAGGRSLAYLLGWRYGDRYLALRSGFDPALAPLSPGSLLFRRALMDLADRGVKEVDLGLGPSGLKTEFAAGTSPETTLRLFGSSLRAEAGRGTALVAGLLRRAAWALLPDRDRMRKRLRTNLTGSPIVLFFKHLYEALR